VKIDWLEGTIVDMPIAQALNQLHDIFPDWQDLDHGGLGYECSSVVLDKGRIYWSGARPANGVHFSLPPSAIELSEKDHEQFARELLSIRGKISRLDLAADDTMAGILDIETIKEAVDKRYFISIAKKQPKEIVDHEGEGRTFYFGRGQSKTIIRIYDKAAERRAAGKMFLGHWIRVEMQLRDERADSAIRYILDHPEEWQAQAAGWLLSSLDFKIPSDDPNKSRWETAPWWLAFLDHTSKERIYISKRVQTIDDLVEWIDNQVGPSLLVVKTVFGTVALSDIADRALPRMKDKHMKYIDQGLASLADHGVQITGGLREGLVIDRETGEVLSDSETNS
jgi:DNA relaxase NicK